MLNLLSFFIFDSFFVINLFLIASPVVGGLIPLLWGGQPLRFFPYLCLRLLSGQPVAGFAPP
jgi:hypothetical protein